MSRHPIDLTGQRYHKLVVMGRAETAPRRPKESQKWLCLCDCGNTTVLRTEALRGDRGNRQKSCGCWKRSIALERRSIDGNGYVRVFRPDHPNARQPKGDLFEHTLVMSEHLGRALLPEELVHHRNGVRHDNRIENLELWTTSHPKGQRVEDMIAWALELLETYHLDHGWAKGDH